ncbi:MAG: hypothetical protein MHPSP_004582, partial [Paramarteilia canceri]
DNLSIFFDINEPSKSMNNTYFLLQVAYEICSEWQESVGEIEGIQVEGYAQSCVTLSTYLDLIAPCDTEVDEVPEQRPQRMKYMISKLNSKVKSSLMSMEKKLILDFEMETNL